MAAYGAYVTFARTTSQVWSMQAMAREPRTRNYKASGSETEYSGYPLDSLHYKPDSLRFLGPERRLSRFPTLYQPLPPSWSYERCRRRPLLLAYSLHPSNHQVNWKFSSTTRERYSSAAILRMDMRLP